MVHCGARQRGYGVLCALSLIACSDDDAADKPASDGGPRDAAVQATGPDAGDGSAADAKVSNDSDARVSTPPDRDAAVSDGALPGPHDAQVDDAEAGPALDAQVDASTACPLASGRLVYFFEGGFVSYQSTYSVSAAGVFQRDRVDRGRPDAGIESCVAALASCGSSDVDGADLEAALAAPAVQAAFSADTALVLGQDRRPVDGSVLVIERADGKRITIGNPCSAGAPGCTPIPAAVESLSDLLYQLASQQASPGRPCASMRL